MGITVSYYNKLRVVCFTVWEPRGGVPCGESRGRFLRKRISGSRQILTEKNLLKATDSYEKESPEGDRFLRKRISETLQIPARKLRQATDSYGKESRESDRFLRKRFSETIHTPARQLRQATHSYGKESLEGRRFLRKRISGRLEILTKEDFRKATDSFP